MSDVLHVLDHSLPEHDGYSFRSHSILTNLIGAGLSIDVVTGPKQGAMHSEADNIDGVNYQRTCIDEDTSTSGIGGQLRTVRLTKRRIAEALRDERSSVIQAHSPCLNGLAAFGHGLPVVYEMRSSWEDASVSVGTTAEGSLRYRISRMLETYVASKADAVVVICEGLKQELMSRGISEAKITVVPNALPEELLALPAAEKVDEVRRRYALDGHKVIGFFGSFFEWEGVDDLLRAMPIVLKVVPDAKLFIAGGGRQEEALHALAKELDLGDRILFAGRVAHDDINALYAAADVMAYPRLPDRLTNMVTPLKPLEAMAQGTAVVASDVGGHKELLTDGETGVLFKAGSYEDLARKLVDVLNGSEDLETMTTAAANGVRLDRRWSVVVQRYLPIYQALRRKAEE